MHIAITGASSGIGRALAELYLAQGANVTMVARRPQKMHQVAGTRVSQANIVVADLADSENACNWVDEAEARFGSIDILVNNAGASVVHPTVDADWAAAKTIMQLNTLTPMKLSCLLAPRMVARGGGCIVDIASVAALAPQPGYYFYNASKGALAAASESLRAELRHSGVHVLTVYPGPIRTPMGDANFSVFDPRIARLVPTGDPQVLAKLIAAAILRRSPRVIYPGVYVLARWFPAIFRWAADRFSPPMRRPRTTI